MRAKKRHEEFLAKGYGELATYNGERSRGLVHTPEWVAKMAALQAQYNAEQIAEAERKGWIVVGYEVEGA